MKQLLGIDLGSTSMSLVVIDGETGSSLWMQSKAYCVDIPPDGPDAHMQDPEQIISQARTMVDAAIQKYPDIGAIGVTGQMHGVILLDAIGKPVSPAYTWRDGRAEWQTKQGRSYRDIMQDELGRAEPTGYAASSLFTLAYRNAIPEQARTITGIPDYLAMQLTETPTPMVGKSLAHSMGLYSLENNHFMTDAWRSFCSLELPELAPTATCIGYHPKGIPVAVAEGDNQCGFLGNIRTPDKSILFNLGTSGQVSLIKPQGEPSVTELPSALEMRPFLGEDILLVGATLSGGKSFELLTRLIYESCRLSGGSSDLDAYALLEKLKRPETVTLDIDTRFNGTRSNPGQRGRIDGIQLNNFTLSQLYWAMAKGVVTELVNLLGPYRRIVEQAEAYGIATGNALERNTALQESLFRQLRVPLRWSVHRETTARGAAMIAGMMLLGGVQHLDDIRNRMVHHAGTPPRQQLL